MLDPTQPGKLHISIDQSRELTKSHAKTMHRMYANVPPADIRPPEGVATILLQSVQCTLSISHMRSGTGPAKPKRLDKRLDRTDAILPQSKKIAKPDLDSEEDSDILFLEESGDAGCLTKRESITSPITTHRNMRKRALKVSINEISPQYLVDLMVHAGGKRDPAVPPSAQHIETLVDAAIRVSACNNLRGSVPGLKFKANTFNQGLADIAPALWRPGFLEVLGHPPVLLKQKR
jgi:hypothetical protein